MKRNHFSLPMALIFCMGCFVLGFLIVSRYQGLFQVISYWKGAPSASSLISTTSARAPVLPEAIRVTKIHSSDGTMRLILSSTPDVKSGTKSNTFTISTVSGQNPHVLFTKNTPLTTSIAIPGNSWSPDNKYVFLVEKDSAGKPSDSEGKENFLVFLASGANIVKEQKFLDVGVQFTEKVKDYTLRDVTGWASPTLLIVYTNDGKGGKGPSFWFDVESRSFIQLSG